MIERKAVAQKSRLRGAADTYRQREKRITFERKMAKLNLKRPISAVHERGTALRQQVGQARPTACCGRPTYACRAPAGEARLDSEVMRARCAQAYFRHRP
jgi:hypothetical protein